MLPIKPKISMIYYSIFALSFLRGCVPVTAAERNYTITRLLDPERAQQIANTINQNFIDLWESKQDDLTTDMNSPRYTVTDILNPEMAEINAFAINQNFEDLWREKAESTQASVKNRPVFTVLDLLNEAAEDDNVDAINDNFEDAWRDLVDR